MAAAPKFKSYAIVKVVSANNCATLEELVDFYGTISYIVNKNDKFYYILNNYPRKKIYKINKNQLVDISKNCG